MHEVISHTIVIIDRNTPLSVHRHPHGPIELTFGRSGTVAPDVDTTASLFIKDPITTIPQLLDVLQAGYVQARGHQPTTEEPKPARDESGHRPPGGPPRLRSV